MRVDFDDTEIAFRSRSNCELRKALSLFRAFRSPALSSAGPKLLQAALALRLPVTPLVKATVFDYFCGGTSIDDCKPVITSLARWGVGAILDYSVEAAAREADFERTTSEVQQVIARAGADASVPFAVFKPSGIARFELLERLAAGGALTAAETAEERRTTERFHRLGAAAAAAGVRLLIDAEESWTQAAVDRYALALMRAHNLQRPIIYNTVQAYRVDRLAYLEDLLACARREGFQVGIKLVRGAYMEKERARARQLGLPDPIHADKAATDRAFDTAARLLLERGGDVGVVIGSHNEASTRLVLETMTGHGWSSDDRRVEFAQLLGMSDNLTFNLAAGGYRASKYVPYGPVRAVLPYLFRRAEENSSIQGQAARTLQLIERELARRAAKRL